MILDVGCDSHPKGHVNIDVNRTITKQKHIPNFILADAQNLPFRDKCFSLIYSSHVIEHLPNPLQALREWKRVAGSVEIYTPSAFDLDQTKDHIYTWNLFTFKNILSIVFKNVTVGNTSAPTVLHGRLGKYLPILNLMLAKLGFRRELKAFCSD
jgi:ubiquinone/menaquinone biosynthesis C-methylase UbiE